MCCLFIEYGECCILIDMGIGDKQDEKFCFYFKLYGEVFFMGSFQQVGFEFEFIIDVLLIYLYFDYVGGVVKYDVDKNFVFVFFNVIYWFNEVYYNWVYYFNLWEKVFFLKENFVFLKKVGVFKFIDV